MSWNRKHVLALVLDEPVINAWPRLGNLGVGPGADG